MTALVFDIECDGLNPTKIFCIVTHDIRTNETRRFTPSQIDEGVAYLKTAEKLIGHNILCFDIPVVNRICKTDIAKDKAVVDTLVLSRLFNPSREGGHGLEGWGYRLGYRKGDFDEFDHYCEEMLEYCTRDVLLNVKVYRQLCREANGFTKQSMEIEHDVARILNDQRTHGFLLDIRYASMLVASLNEELKECVDEVHKTFRPKKIITPIQPVRTKAGKISKMAKRLDTDKNIRLTADEYAEALASDGAELERVEYEPFNLGSRKQIGEYLIEFGWKPKKFTPTNQPIVDESTLEGITNIPEAAMIARYLMLQKRVAQIQSWIEAVEPDDRVRGYVNTNGAVTGRMTHSKPNMAQIPSTNSPYGKECRSCWIVPEGYKLVGIDASGLELRMLAHYMNDGDFTNEILNGDIHSANQRAAGLESRNQAKTFIYALLYGAGDAKLGSITGGGAKEGGRLRDNFFANLPAFKHLKDRVARASQKGWIKGLDGRKVFVRSEHSALNTVLQSAGAIVMKAALVLLERYIREAGYDAHFVCNIHDEWQIEVREDQAESVGKLGVKAIQDAGNMLNLHCRLDGEYSIGDGWHETH